MTIPLLWIDYNKTLILTLLKDQTEITKANNIVIEFYCLHALKKR